MLFQRTLPRTAAQSALILLCSALSSVLLAPAQARASAFHWEKITAIHLRPSQIFSRLGLTHNTRHGSASSKADPKFPAGVTDVVPYDVDNTLMVRGTDAGLAQFGRRVESLDSATSVWQLTVSLVRRTDDGEETVATRALDNVGADTPVQFTLGDDPDSHAYQLHLHVGTDGSLALACQCGFPLPSRARAEAAARAAGVFVPSLAWGDPVSQIVRPGVPMDFENDAADLRAAPVGMGLIRRSSDSDLILRVTVGAPPSGTDDASRQ